ncbi:hypothetical protein AB1Y20_002815 [Prymnesium parvum]|uniref:Uncharacterized protein n=1 Tax=Prymnesium parvum TaxID=97485 RepID=A0AB34JA76_PRYPA
MELEEDHRAELRVSGAARGGSWSDFDTALRQKQQLKSTESVDGTLTGGSTGTSGRLCTTHSHEGSAFLQVTGESSSPGSRSSEVASPTTVSSRSGGRTQNRFARTSSRLICFAFLCASTTVGLGAAAMPRCCMYELIGWLLRTTSD